MKLSMDNTPKQNIEICKEEIIKLRKETEKDDVEIYSDSFGFGTGLTRLCIVITRNSLGEYSLIHYQADLANPLVICFLNVHLLVVHSISPSVLSWTLGILEIKEFNSFIHASLINPSSVNNG